ncbi:MAG: metal-dependent hydrolase [Paraburkholderia sp.]|uniref:metal-dependent hydrolase n=1 Tax=Burkholderiaceae TaxID=119060 RepID=UPI0010F799E0|nr:metal-dependent hydrolase [Burkholderia sp. 4M9327F10]
MSKPEIRRRDLDFPMSDDIPVHWLDGECHITRYYDSLSIMFPEGERAFIESVCLFRDGIAPGTPLAREVAGFIGQEAIHRREHQRYNARLAAQGAPIDALEHKVARQQEIARRYLPGRVRLAITICLEHFTAMLADQMLRHPATLKGADPRMSRIWLWHAVEETEHKGVAFDVFTSAIRNPVARYALRCAAMLWVTAIFTMLAWSLTISLVKHDRRLTDWRGWGRLLRYHFGSPGPLRRIAPHWLAWFAPGFHPWQHDNRELVRAAYRNEDVPWSNSREGV